MRQWRMCSALIVCVAVLAVGCVAELRPAMAVGKQGQVTQEALAAAASPSGPAADAQPVKLVVEMPQRVVIYSGVMGLVVSDIRQTLETIRAQAVTMGGYMQEMDACSIMVRVPAGRFNDAVAFVATLGEIVQQHIKSQDVTEEMRDLKIRLDNAQQTRTRLLGILEKSQKVEDTLKIEAELERVTQTIELLKGKIQMLESQVAFSVLKVQLNSPLPQKQLIAAIPFQWVRQLGEGVISGVVAAEAQTSWRDRRRIPFDPPKSYIRYFDHDCVTEAMSAEGVLIKVQKQENYKGGDLEFWGKLARRALVENRSVAFTRDDLVELRSGAKARVMSGTRDIGGKESGYLIGIVATKEWVYAFEAWGPVKEFSSDLSAIEISLKSLDADRW